MHRMHDARRNVRRKCVVVALIEREVSKLTILYDMLIKEAVQCPTL